MKEDWNSVPKEQRAALELTMDKMEQAAQPERRERTWAGFKGEGDISNYIWNETTIKWIFSLEPIVDLELWERVQEVNGKRRRMCKAKREPSIFFGIAYCPDCGRRITFFPEKTNRNSERKTYFGSCASYRLNGPDGCTPHRIKEQDLYDIVLKDIREWASMALADKKADTISKLNDSLAEALDPSDKLEQIEKTYEESAKGIYDSCQNQIDGINGETENTKQYQNLLAKAQKLEQKKDTKGLSKSEQATLDKYNAELEALRTGATGNNITDYVKTWEAWYSLQQKFKKNGKLSDSDAKKYDTYKAKLEA